MRSILGGDTFDGSLANSCDVNCSVDHKNDDYDDGNADTSSVGTYSPNGYELYDMAGNIWEWVVDWYAPDYYVTSPSDNPQGPENGEYRVLRGGSWNYDPLDLGTAIRGFNLPSNTGNYFGFRCARSP